MNITLENPTLFCKNLYEKWLTSQKDKSLQNVYTPFKLVADMLNHVDTLNGKDVLVLANLEVYLLIRWGKSKNKPDFNYNSIKFVTDNSTFEGRDDVVIANFNDINSLNLNMQFDVVIGNPPYQEGTRADAANKLWPKFVKLGSELVVDGGLLVMITPNSWLTPSADIGKGRSGFSIFSNLFKRYHLAYANIDSASIKSKYFPTVGSTFSYFVMNKTSIQAPTTFKTSLGTFNLNISQHNYLPVILNNESLSIMNKFASIPERFNMINQSHEVKSDKVNGLIDSMPKPSEEFHYANYHTSAKGGTYKYTAVPHSRMTTPKVMISVSGNYLAVPDSGEMGFTGMCITTPTDNPEQVAALFNSKLYRFAVYNTKFAGFNPGSTILQFPKVDTTRTWTNEELYNHFNLTQEEISLIESTIS